MKVPPTVTGTRIEDFEQAYNADEQYQHFLDANAALNNVVLNAVNEEYADTAGGAADSDFSEYMWMENEEEFDKEVLQRLEEEELMEQCMIRHMLDNERPVGALMPQQQPQQQQQQQPTPAGAQQGSSAPRASTLNPHAAEFVPSWGRAADSAAATLPTVAPVPQQS